jgi:hypothetical protein
MSSPPEDPQDLDAEQEDERYDPVAVARISTQAELKTIRLAFLHADIDERGEALPSDWSADAIMGFNSVCEFDRETKTLVVVCGFLAMYVPDKDKVEVLPTPKEAPFELHSSFRLAYALRDVAAIEDTDPEQFAATNGVLHAWPYWRELAHSMTVRMGVAPLLVGTYKLPWSGDPKPTTAEPPV